jgi:aminoglycoside 6'-N-acetyltransferase
MLAYVFRPVSARDLPLLRQWLATPEVVRWWGDPDEQAELLKQDISDPRMVMRIVSFEGKPFAYAQDYAVHSWPQPHFVSLPADARAIDSFIGEPDMIGRGHGAVYLRLLAEQLRAEGAPLVAIDPNEGNHRARRAYKRAGFRGETVVESVDGRVVPMFFYG